MGSFLNRLSAVGRSDGHQNVTFISRKLTQCGKTGKCQTRTVFSTSRPGWALGSWLGTRQGFLHFGMLRVVEAMKRELGLPNEIDGAVPMIINADNVVMAHGYRA